MSVRGTIVTLCSVSIAGCTGGYQSALDPAGPQSGRIYGLWWLLFVISIVVWIAVMLVLGAAVARRRAPDSLVYAPGLTRHVSIAVAVSVLLVFVIFVASVLASGGIATMPHRTPLDIEIVGHQWWWEVNYADRPVDQRISTANEIHIPVHRPIRIKVTAHDVIHSFWVPNLHGKLDLIPGKSNMTWFEADRPGVYRGQCAEFCGMQHAHMGLFVIAEDEKQFESWYHNQQQPSPHPGTPQLLKGQEAFLSLPCVVCHTIRGTVAAGRTGPDLTHLASRTTIAAGTLPNTRGNLGGWIVDSQQIKPGNYMPAMNIPSEQVQPLLDYLGSLK